MPTYVRALNLLEIPHEIINDNISVTTQNILKRKMSERIVQSKVPLELVLEYKIKLNLLSARRFMVQEYIDIYTPDYKCYIDDKDDPCNIKLMSIMSVLYADSLRQSDRGESTTRCEFILTQLQHDNYDI